MSALRWAAAACGLLLVAVAACLGTMRLGWWNPTYATVAADQAGPPSRFIMVGDVKLHLRDEGQGPVLIMLHSSMANLREWDRWADLLKTQYRVIRIDWPPYGLSIDPSPSRGMTGIVELLDRFVTQEKLERFTLVGSSSGATICVLYAAAHPQKLQALALSTLPLAAPPPTQFSAVQTAIQWIHTNITPDYYPRFYYRLSLSALYGVPARLTPQTVGWYYQTNAVPGGFAKVQSYMSANRSAVWSKGAAKEAGMIKVPVLLQWGDRDPVLPMRLADTAKTEFSAAPVTLIHYPDVGHYPMLELPVQTGEDLKHFLDRVYSTAPPAEGAAK